MRAERVVDQGTAATKAVPTAILVDAPKNSGEAITSLWLVFTIHNGEPTFLGIFHDQHLAKDYAAKIEGARVERVALRDTARAFDAKALIG